MRAANTEIAELLTVENTFFDDIEWCIENGGEYLDCILDWCDTNNAEFEVAAALIKNNQNMKLEVTKEAERLNLIPKTKRLKL